MIASLTEAVLEKGEHLSFAVRGCSMVPTLQDGDRIEVGPLQKETLLPGRLLVYRGAKEEVIVHRLMNVEAQKEETVCLISPDAEPLSPERIRLDRVLGVVRHAFRGETELSLDHGWRFWWGRLLTTGFRRPWILRILFRLGRIRWDLERRIFHS